MNVLVFDIETVPDIDGARRLHDFEALSDLEVAEALFCLRRQEQNGAEVLRLPLQKIVAISAVLHSGSQLKVWSLGEVDSSEKELIQRFFAGIEKYTPTLVSWNGGGFDLPVLHYRALLHGVTAARYWDMGEEDREFKWNNYISRYHSRHTDLMDLLALYQPKAYAPLDQVASLLGFPGKMGMKGDQVWPTYLAGDLTKIRNYCETDVLNTYLIYLRYLLMRGQLDEQGYAQQQQKLLDYLIAHPYHEHWQQFAVRMNQHDS